ncbi:glycosyltransferase family 2 protein [Pedobacter sp. Leaf170]|uniref:glycosyltransferase family 2 protein n=1 Tax=Pedobacter sp. Leaf170 TaxID=2876558 RepID=UPI001E594C99|nr:galactosyltransferase-related protein [Pedobacter sp. Leaf170]
MKKISVVTIVKNRQPALENVIIGLSQNTRLPNELIVIHMNEEPYNLKNQAFEIEAITMCGKGLPLAAARNFAIKHATFEHVIFLDADCIPAADLIMRYSELFSKDMLLCGRTKYLPKSVMQYQQFWTDLNEISEPDPVRSSVEQYPYELFWSLNFACSKTVYSKIGGYDEGYIGYGAEDTDFAFSARAAGVEMQTVDAFAYHQYHASYNPPLNHLNDIVANAMYFYQKWKKWPMEGWLKRFADMKLIKWENDSIELIRNPSADEMLSALK